MPTRLNWEAFAALLGLHLAALLVLVPWLFDWRSVGFALVAMHAFGLAINICYHRQLAHRSFKTPLWLEHALVVIALCCLQNTPAIWVANHRMHHRHADQREDPHSPLVSFAWAQWGWLCVLNEHLLQRGASLALVQDILDDPWYRRLEHGSLRELVYGVHLALIFGLGYAWGWLDTADRGEALRLGLSFVVWGGLLRTVVTLHITSSVNSLSHMFGYQTHKTGDASRNNVLVGLMADGEGWHNNHHANPRRATTQCRWWELDVAYYVIWGLEKAGLASEVHR